MSTHFFDQGDEGQWPLDPAATFAEEDEALAHANEELGGVKPADDTMNADEGKATDETMPVVRKKRAARSTSTGQPRRRRPREDSIIELRVPLRADETTKPLIDPADDDVARDELVAQGFTTDEAARIVDLSTRLGTSREARDAEASLRRLRFTRWLVERGVLDEFSA